MKSKVLAFTIVALTISNIALYNVNSVVAYAAEKTIDQANEELDVASEELDEVSSNLIELEEETKKIQSQINSVQANIEDINSRNMVLEEENENIKNEIQDIQIEKEEKYELIKSVIRIQYEQNSIGYLGLLLESKSLSNFLMRFELVSNLIKNSNYLVEEISKLEDTLTEKSKRLEEQIKEIEKQKVIAESERVKLEELVVKRDEEKEKLIALKGELEAEITSIEDEIASLASGGNYEGGEMIWPVPGYYNISSYFGYREDPITGEGSYHNAIDIPAPAGTSVVASAPGTVIKSEYSSSFGNLVVIDHGGGVLSYYAHNTSNLVAAGQQVTAGQTIATVGTTGYSTGNHSHFGVQVNGVFVDPMQYLSS